MTVRDLIERLKKLPQSLDVRYWSDTEDDWSDVADVLYEAGSWSVDLLDYVEEGLVEAEPEE